MPKPEGLKVVQMETPLESLISRCEAILQEMDERKLVYAAIDLNNAIEHLRQAQLERRVGSGR